MTKTVDIALDDNRPRVDTDIFKLSGIGDLLVIKDLVAAGNVDVNARDEVACTPLIWASRGGSDDVVEFLCGNGADLELAGYGGMRAIHHACNCMCERSMVQLLEMNAQVSQSRDVCSRLQVLVVAREPEHLYSLYAGGLP